MAEDVVIRAEGLGKRYMIGHQAERERYNSLRDVMARNARNLARSARDLVTGRANVGGDKVEEFWALKDVDFDIRRGEVVGLVGRNGAGKSTLLKVLSRITEPSQGRVEIRGRVASLLEVGTGFHPELTGRENIFLNGAILGMTRAEIRRKFDEIVTFAEVERFLDTPVKRYSSGMYVRLAFAVAAHLEPEILVIDEVLAVGDAEFQKKCLGKMEETAGRGRTVLFVSHNMAALQALCPRALWLANGRKVGDGASRTIVDDYLGKGAAMQADQFVPRQAGPSLRLVGVGFTEPSVLSRGPLRLALQFEGQANGVIRECALILHSLRGERIGIVDLRETGALPQRHEKGLFTIEVDVPTLPLIEGAYGLGLYMVSNDFGGELNELTTFDVGPETRALGFTPYAPQDRGFVAIESVRAAPKAGRRGA